MRRLDTASWKLQRKVCLRQAATAIEIEPQETWKVYKVISLQAIKIRKKAILAMSCCSVVVCFIPVH